MSRRLHVSIGYDSRWGEAKRAQQRAAVDSKPASIMASPSDVAAPDAGRKSLSIRVRPNSSYLAQTADVPKRVADLLDDANAVLWPSLGVRLELDRIEPWSSDVDQRLQPALDALSREDEGKDVSVRYVSNQPSASSYADWSNAIRPR